MDYTGNIEWGKNLGGYRTDIATSVQQTTDEGYILAGTSLSNDGDVTEGTISNAAFWLVKLDNFGNIQWQKTLGGTNPDAANSIQQTTDGGYIVAGVSNSNDGDVSGNHGMNDYWIVKLDEFGNIQWQKSLGGSNTGVATSIRQTVEGGYVISGRSNSNDGDVSGNHGGFDYWVVKIDELGNIQWQKSLGGTGSDFAFSVEQTTDGGYIVAGDSTSNNGDITGNHGFDDYWVVKLDENGNIQWQKSLGGSANESGASIKQTIDGGYVLRRFFF